MACLSPLNCENEYLVLALALGEETADEAVVGSIVWAFRRLKKPRSREMSARGYALRSVRPNIPFFPSFNLRVGLNSIAVVNLRRHGSTAVDNQRRK